MALIANESYSSEELAEKATDKDIRLITTSLRCRKPREILTQFKLSHDGHAVAECPKWHTPKRIPYIRRNDSIQVSLDRCCYENCTHQKEYKTKIKVHTATLIFSLGAQAHAEEAIRRNDDKIMKLIGQNRNGVETVPSFLTREYHVDAMPVMEQAEDRGVLQF